MRPQFLLGNVARTLVDCTEAGYVAPIASIFAALAYERGEGRWHIRRSIAPWSMPREIFRSRALITSRLHRRVAAAILYRNALQSYTPQSCGRNFRVRLAQVMSSHR
jgi:hypothetical protein